MYIGTCARTHPNAVSTTNATPTYAANALRTSPSATSVFTHATLCASHDDMTSRDSHHRARVPTATNERSTATNPKKNNILVRPRARLRERALDDARASLSRSESQPSTRGWGVRDPLHRVTTPRLDRCVRCMSYVRVWNISSHRTYCTMHEPIDHQSGILIDSG